MSVTPQDVKKLRDKTGAGMLDCKNALVKAEGNFSAAEKILKEQGLASADKRIGRATNNGAVFTSITETKAAMVELSCETDFVAKNEVFRSTGEKLAAAVAAGASKDSSDELQTIVKEAIAVLKENMLLGKTVCWDVADNELVVNYSHNSGVIAVMVKMQCENAQTLSHKKVQELAFDLALHAAAYNPAYLDRNAVDASYIREQTDIFSTQAKNLGDKPEKVIEGIVKGKIEKHLSQICYMEQGFVKEDKTKVKDVIAAVAKDIGSTVKLVDYAYIAVGQEDD